MIAAEACRNMPRNSRKTLISSNAQYEAAGKSTEAAHDSLRNLLVGKELAQYG